MGLNRYAKRKDANQDLIVKALEQVGAEVWVLDRPCDLAVWFRQGWYMFETKTPHGRYTPLQQAERAKGKGQGIVTVKTPMEAVRAIGATTVVDEVRGVLP